MGNHLVQWLKCHSGYLYPVPECLGLTPGSTCNSSFLLMLTLGASKWRLKWWGPFHPSGRSRFSSQLLASIWLSPNCCRHLEKWTSRWSAGSLSFSHYKKKKSFTHVCPTNTTQLSSMRESKSLHPMAFLVHNKLMIFSARSFIPLSRTVIPIFFCKA